MVRHLEQLRFETIIFNLQGWILPLKAVRQRGDLFGRTLGRAGKKPKWKTSSVFKYKALPALGY